MGGVVNGALGTASNLVGGLPIVGGMARSAIGQAGSMLGQPQQGQQQGGMAGGKGGGQGGLFGGMAGGKGGPSAMNMATGGWGGKGGLMDRFAALGNGQNPFQGGAGAPMSNSWNPWGAPQQQSPGGRFGGGYAANGRSLMPTGQQAQGTGASGMASTNNGQTANSQLNPSVWGGPGSPGW